MKKIISTKTILLLLTLWWISTPVFASEPAKLEVHDAWIREAPPMVKILAGYLTLLNQSNKSHTILSVSSPQFERTEIHRTEIKDGVASMSPVPKIIIKSHDKVLFEPGGLHLMLINPKNAVKKGDKVEITLHLSDKSTLAFVAVVKKGTETEDHTHHGSMHH